MLEVFIAALVMTLTLTSSLQVVGRGLQAIDSARYSTLAGQILQSQMEKLRLLSWSQLTNPANGSPVGAINYTTFTPDPGLISTNQVNNFTCTQSIALDSNHSNTIADITLTAAWTGSDGMKRSRTYYTIYAKDGISDFIYKTDSQ